MPGRFETYGPFDLPRTQGVVDSSGLSAMWDQINQLHPGLKLKDGVGAYIVARQVSPKRLIPLYVGRTERGYESRFKQHLSGKKSFVGKLKDAPDGKLNVFLLALHTSAKGALRKRAKPGSIRVIKALEFMLIGTCLKLNKNLINMSNSTLHRALQVPGFINDEKTKRNDSSSRLASMLKAD